MDRKQKQLFRFLLSVVMVFLGWIIISHLFLQDGNPVDDFLRISEANWVIRLLGLVGYEVYVEVGGLTKTVLFLDGGERLIGIEDSCNGLVLLVVFVGFVLSFPSRWIDRLKFIPVGVLFIYVMNVVRIFALALIQIHYPQYLDFNHHYTFTILVYLDIFLLWMAYVKKYGRQLEVV